MGGPGRGGGRGLEEWRGEWIPRQHPLPGYVPVSAVRSDALRIHDKRPEAGAPTARFPPGRRFWPALGAAPFLFSKRK